MKISARNVIKGTIQQINIGAINAEVVVATASGETLVSVITLSSVRNMELAVGKEVYAVIKASNVMIATD